MREEPGRLQSMGFSRKEYWRGLPFPSPGYLPNPGIEPRSPALQVDSLPTELQGKPPSLIAAVTFKLILLAYTCFTMLCQLLPHSKVNQLHIYIPCLLDFLPIQVNTVQYVPISPHQSQSSSSSSLLLGIDRFVFYVNNSCHIIMTSFIYLVNFWQQDLFLLIVMP